MSSLHGRTALGPNDALRSLEQNVRRKFVVHSPSSTTMMAVVKHVRDLSRFENPQPPSFPQYAHRRNCTLPQRHLLVAQHACEYIAKPKGMWRSHLLPMYLMQTRGWCKNKRALSCSSRKPQQPGQSNQRGVTHVTTDRRLVLPILSSQETAGIVTIDQSHSVYGTCDSLVLETAGATSTVIHEVNGSNPRGVARLQSTKSTHCSRAECKHLNYLSIRTKSISCWAKL